MLFKKKKKDSSPVENLSQEPNSEFQFLPSFPSVCILSCFVCSVGDSPVSPAAGTSQAQMAFGVDW